MRERENSIPIVVATILSQIMMVILKLSGTIHWSWFFVFFPTWLTILAFALMLIVIILFAGKNNDN